MNHAIVIDFETANGSPSSVCSVGIVIMRDGEVVDSFYSLIHPYPDYYAWFCQQVHGLRRDCTKTVVKRLKPLHAPGKGPGEPKFIITKMIALFPDKGTVFGA